MLEPKPKSSLNLSSPEQNEAIIVYKDYKEDYNQDYPVKQTPFLKQIVNKAMRRARINGLDLSVIGLLLIVFIYFIVKEPMLISIISAASLTFFGLWKIFLALPILEKLVGSKIRFWHVVAAIMTVTALLNTFETPAQAIFLSGLETFMQGVATAAQGAGGTQIPAATISLIFNLIRGVFLLLVGAAALFAYNQAQQGNDYRPIVTQIGLAFGIVLALDIITQLFVPQ